MRRRKKIMGFVLVTLLFFLYNASVLLAFNDEPCTGLNYEHCLPPAMTDQSGDWRIILDEPEYVEGKWKWTYHVYSSPTQDEYTGANFVAFLFPDCCNDDEKIDIFSTIPANSFEYEVAEGEETIYFGRYNNQAFVLKITPESTSGKMEIYTDTNTKTRSTIIIKSGKTVEQFEMAVPGCPIAPPSRLIGAGISSTTYICTNIDTNPDYPISMQFQRDPDTGYAIPYTVRFFQALDCPGDGFEPDEIGIPDPLVYCTGGPENKLNECIKLTSESPGCVEYYIANTLCKYCWK